jgi:glucose-1-phosphate cytidylyltransferase
VAFHRSHGKLATVTAVRPPAKFGALDLHDDLVRAFDEKPQTGEGWVNGGFFLLEPEVLEYVEGDTTAWESTPMEQLAKDGQLVAYRHDGFWHCVDTLRDLQTLQRQWDTGRAPWRIWQ